jgi:chromosome segregation ATPase
MVLKSIELVGFKSFARRTSIILDSPVTAIVGPNGSGKSNIVEAIRFVLGEQSIKSLRGKGGSDLIFKGSKNLSPLNRASVTIVFDNKNKVFSFADSLDTKTKLVSYDEIRIKREVFSDGSNKYSINETEVRLKDIIELLSSVNIGSSGHHIISQGEADRILSSNSRDRRLMIEDALGLKIYQYRIKETEKRLEKTEINMKEVSALKRELAPHLVYLKKQVEKIEKADNLRKELIDLYEIYCSREKQIISLSKNKFIERRDILKEQFNEVQSDLFNLEKEKNAPFNSLFEKDYLSVIDSLSQISRLKNELERSLGRLEGIKEALATPKINNKEKLIPASFIKEKLREIQVALEDIKSSSDLNYIHEKVKQTEMHIKEHIDTFSIQEGQQEEQVLNISEIEKIDNEIKDIEKNIFDIEDKKKSLEIQKSELEGKMSDERNQHSEKQKGYYEVLSKKEIIESDIKSNQRELEIVLQREEFFENEIKEGVALLGIDMPSVFDKVFLEEDYTESQDDLKRKIERIKIKLEESGGLGGSDTIKEYETTQDRNNFLTQELLDLEKSIQELRQLISELKLKLDLDFRNGIEKINHSFNNFFSLMFGGGNASLSISVEHTKKRKLEEDEYETEIDIPIKDETEMDFERGIEIHVSLPQKKVKELGMLSGGERSLTSIALLFAMSQVNPPPFLVLDETDAALDEANSKRYGDMIENLSSVSELIVVTHNRETMSRAGILYGITIGSDGASKLLSIRFDDATSYAK